MISFSRLSIKEHSYLNSSTCVVNQLEHITYHYVLTKLPNRILLSDLLHQALLQAKQSGKDRYFIFDTEHEKTLRGHQENIQRLQQALAASEFILLYQPKVNMQSGEIIGLKALSPPWAMESNIKRQYLR